MGPELERVLREADERTRAVGRLASSIAHDLNNLLTVIQGYGQLLSEKLSDSKQAAEIHEVLVATERARTLARQLVALSQQAMAAPAAVRTTPNVLKSAEGFTSAERKVLVVEDQTAIRALVRRVLQREGFGVLEASESSGAEALFDEHSAEIALVVTDVAIPGEKGTALFRRLISKKPDLRVVYMSGQIAEAVLGDEPPATHERFLAKPFTAAGLIDVVHDALGD